VKKEALVAGWIGDQAGLPIPRWIALDERRILLPSRFALMTWLQGAQVRSLIGAPDVDQVYRQMGALLKRLHGLPMTAYGYIVGDGIGQAKTTNAEYMRSAFDKAFRQFREHEGDAGLMQRLEHEVKQSFDVVAHSVGPVFCHNDLHQGNVLATRDDDSGVLKLSGLLDFANASAGDPLLDLAYALFCCTHEDPRSREPLLAGYGEIDHPDREAALRLYTLYHRVVMWSHLKRLNILGVAGDPVGLLQDLNEMCG
jgi:aminoglycoside phosphotransferase (APT) family kinase protein